jgi:hypothetical protein
MQFRAQRCELQGLIGEVLERGITVLRRPLRVLGRRHVVRESLEVELDRNRAGVRGRVDGCFLHYG